MSMMLALGAVVADVVFLVHRHRARTAAEHDQLLRRLRSYCR